MLSQVSDRGTQLTLSSLAEQQYGVEPSMHGANVPVCPLPGVGDGVGGGGGCTRPPGAATTATLTAARNEMTRVIRILIEESN